MTGDGGSQLRARIDALSGAQRHALTERLTLLRNEPQRLVGFVVADSASPPTDEALRSYLGARVPEYMIPSQFVTIERMPRNAAGKLDRHALRQLVGTEITAVAERTGIAPRNEIEKKLAAIWKEVLKLEEVGVDDDFFEIGGDSLLSIRVIARAGREGIRIAPERFFERPTIAHMAAGIASTGVRAAANGTAARIVDPIGEAPLTPIQNWFFEAIPHHREQWNQSYLLEVGHALDRTQVQTIVRELVAHHDALRVRFTCRDGNWRQHIEAPNANAPCRVVDLHDVPMTEYAARVTDECEREHASLRLEEATLFRCVFFDGAADRRRILLLGHHLVLDNVSWSVILEDVATLVTQTVSGTPRRLPEKTASSRAWAVALAEHAASPSVADAAAYWSAMRADGESASDRGFNRDSQVLTIALGAEESREVLYDAPRQMQASAQAILLAALVLTWHEWAGADELRLDLEGHGRDVLGDALDVSRTVGWFTTVFPVRLSIAEEGNGAGPPVASIVSAVQTTLDALPLRGAAHGLGRYLAPNAATRDRLAAQPRPAVLFNYLGTHDLTLPAASRLRVVDEPHGHERHPDAPRPYLLEINSRVEHGMLIVTVEFNRRVHSAASMEQFATAFRTSLDAVARDSATPSLLPGVDASSLGIVAELLAELDEA